jgi:DNA-binding transcriptional LysR family regulator
MRDTLVPAALRYVDQVARSGSIHRAAKELNVAASAINRQILHLEEGLGVKLFDRVPRGMRLTSAGDTMVTMARRGRADERRASSELRQLQGISQGHVRLVAMDSHVNGFLPDLIERLARDYPLITLEVEVANTDEAVAALIGGSADLAAVFNLTPRRDLHVLWSCELPFGCVVAPTHALAAEASTSLQEAAAHPLALQSRSLMIRRNLDARHGWIFQDGQNRLETNSLQLLKVLARSGRYVAFTSELDAAPELMDGTLVFVPIRDAAAEPQMVSVVIDAKKPLTKIGKIVADRLAADVANSLELAKQKRASKWQKYPT